MKERLDVLLVKRGLAVSREKAKAVIMAGNVYVDNQKEDKAGTMFQDTVKIEVRGNTLKYVSRGGLKLEKAMTHFGVTLKDKVCMDVGSSTGGFTDCMPLMWDTDSWTGSCETMSGLSAWKKPTSAMWFRRICRSRQIFPLLMFLLFLLPRCCFRFIIF